MIPHQHYDEVQDKRWTCRRQPCLLHDVAPEPVVVPDLHAPPARLPEQCPRCGYTPREEIRP